MLTVQNLIAEGFQGNISWGLYKGNNSTIENEILTLPLDIEDFI